MKTHTRKLQVYSLLLHSSHIQIATASPRSSLFPGEQAHASTLVLRGLGASGFWRSVRALPHEGRLAAPAGLCRVYIRKLRTLAQRLGPWCSGAPAAAAQPQSSPTLQAGSCLESECSLFSYSALSGQPLREEGRFETVRAHFSTWDIQKFKRPKSLGRVRAEAR